MFSEQINTHDLIYFFQHGLASWIQNPSPHNTSTDLPVNTSLPIRTIQCQPLHNILATILLQQYQPQEVRL